MIRGYCVCNNVEISRTQNEKRGKYSNLHINHNSSNVIFSILYTLLFILFYYVNILVFILFFV